MDKYKVRSTIYLVFLLVSLFVNGMFLYMLISGENKDKVVNDDNDEVNVVTVSLDEIKSVYHDAYNYINGVNIFIDTGYKLNYNTKCNLVNFNGMEDYFSVKAIDEMKKYLVFDDNNYYDCSNTLNSSLFNSILGNKERDLEIVLSSEDKVLVKSNFKYGCDEIDDYPLYMILVKTNDKWLIDSYE